VVMHSSNRPVIIGLFASASLPSRSEITKPTSEVRRNADGSIDIAFYRERAQRLRWEANREICRSIREFSCGWRLCRRARYGSLGGGTSETPRDLIGKRLMADVSNTDGIFGLLDASVSRFECAS
jgi:hypothetical protein